MLKEGTLPWLRYWRNCLADAESGVGVISPKRKGQFETFWRGCFRDGSLRGDLNCQKILRQLFKGEPDDALVVKVLIRPCMLNSIEEHGKHHESTRPKHLSPIICPVWVSRSGQFYPAERPTIPRDLLSPQAEDTLTFFDVRALDVFHARHPFNDLSEISATELARKALYPPKSTADTAEQSSDAQHIGPKLWQNYRELCLKLYSEFRKSLEKHHLANAYVELITKKMHYIKYDDATGMSRNILALYDWLQKPKLTLPLLDNFAELSSPQIKACTPFEKNISARLGHSNSAFPLAAAQRDAMIQSLSLASGEMLAINGPPGTGKTTFVLSFVASLWIKAAIEEQEPPLIVASSVNNQAVTNILDAFAKDFEETDAPISGRWLPDLKSYGGYFPAPSREAAAAQIYQTQSFFNALEVSEYVERAEACFIKHGVECFNLSSSATVASVRHCIHSELLSCQSKLDRIEKAWCLRKAAIESLQAITAGPEAVYHARITAILQNAQSRQSALASAQQLWQQYTLTEPLSLQLFRWLPPVARRLQLRRHVFVTQHFDKFIQEQVLTESPIKDTASIASELGELSEQVDAEAVLALKVVKAYEVAHARVKAAENDWLRALAEAAIVPARHLKNIEDIAGVDAALDKSLRFYAFQLTVHYWEARWLEACRELQEKNGKKYGPEWARPAANGEEASKARWRRRMMIAPCIVSTLHSLPSHFTCTKYHSDRESSEKYERRYLINEIDWLILDEAGQISPEIVAAAMGLSKRALAIGDIHQLPPVRSLTGSIDVGNLLRYEVIETAEAADTVQDSGARVTSGSMMQVAHRVSAYHYLPEAEPGMYLREHRRCYNQIIGFNNALCYQGLLQPKRGDAAPDALFPAMGYLHIDGLAESGPDGQSQRNILEANLIAAWLSAHREDIEQYYNKEADEQAQWLTLEMLVGVVTPFRSQKFHISRACEQHGIAVGLGEAELTVGTVHALQGAERRIVIFSSVYSRHKNGAFIDDMPSLLNVAVSRAKDAFLVFGDMDTISGAPHGTPRAVLARHLLERDDNALQFDGSPRPDLLKFCGEPKVISDAENHDAYLRMIFEYAQKRVVLVSPWVILERLQALGFMKLMAQAVAKGVEVRVYTDYHFNTKVNNTFNAQKQRAFDNCCERLAEMGVLVHIVDHVHSKLLLVDEEHLAVGSFNWFSASREARFKNMETTMVYTGKLEKEIAVQIKQLEARTLKVIELESEPAA